MVYGCRVAFTTHTAYLDKKGDGSTYKWTSLIDFFKESNKRNDLKEEGWIFV